MNLIKHFPSEIKTIREQQREALNFIEQSFANGIKFVCMDASTGAGKSGVAMTISRAYGGGIVGMPTVALQQQYLNDFNDVAPLVGRARFPCLKLDPNAHKCYPIIQAGELPARPPLEQSCAAAPCLNRPKAKQQQIRNSCEAMGGCPHQKMLDEAQKSETIISNLHSLLYSVSLNERITKRPILVIDECHNLFKFIQDFSKINFLVRRKVLDLEIKHLKTTEQWSQWLSLPEQMNLITKEDSRDSYVARLEKLKDLKETVQSYYNDPQTGYLKLTVTPTYIGGLAQSMLFSLADKIVLLSGTILSKQLFTRPLGIDPQTTAYKQIESDFPVENRPVYLPQQEGLDLSFKHLDANLPKAAEEVNRIIGLYEGKKGILHTNSYSIANKLVDLCKNQRIITHVSEDFAEKLAEFKASKDGVFVSPIISEGHDFKDDLARFNIILAPSFEPAGDAYIKWALEKGLWVYYNYNAVKVLLQQLGRGVRHNKDFCDNWLIDSRFTKFLQKVKGLIPDWQWKAISRRV
jgi:Rad3-related DNA helicase